MANGNFYFVPTVLQKPVSSSEAIAVKAEFEMCKIHQDTPLRPAANKKEKGWSFIETFEKVKLICPECFRSRVRIPLGAIRPPLWQ
jgi:hypothetical protein